MIQHVNYSDLRAVPYEQLAARTEGQRMHVRAQIEELTNKQLFDDYSSILAGDDWDGEFTPGGYMVMEELQTELTLRLKKIGFLADEEEVL